MNGTHDSQLARTSSLAPSGALLLSITLSLLTVAPVSAQTSTAPTDGASTTSGTPASSDESATTEETSEAEDAAPTDGTASALSAPTEEEGEGEGEADSDHPRTEAEAEEAQAETEPLAWRNSFIGLTGGATFNSFVRDGQLSYNPYVYAGLFITPRWYVAPTLFFVANFSAYYEFTNADSDTYNHEIALSDTTLDLRYTAAVDRFVFIPSARLTFPTSKTSQGAQRYFNTGLGLTAVMQIPEFLSSNISVGFAYRRWWAGSNVPLTSPYPSGSTFPTANDGSTAFRRSGSFAASSGEIGSFADSTGGSATAADRLLLSVGINVTPVSGLTLSLSGAWVWDHAFDNSAAYLDCNIVVSTSCGTSQLVPESATNYRWRVFTSYSFQAAYDFLPWLNIGLGVSNATSLAPFWNDNGSVRSPFGPDTQVYLSATITLDGLYEQITAGGEDDGLTPEERQRRRQGLASLDGDETSEEEESSEAPASRTPVAF